MQATNVYLLDAKLKMKRTFQLDLMTIITQKYLINVSGKTQQDRKLKMIWSTMKKIYRNFELFLYGKYR